MTAQVIVDWGSSNFRAYRFHSGGAVAAQHQATAGILTVSDGDFEAVLEREIGAWITPDTTVLLSGMITSRNGWVETPYAFAPAALADIGRRAMERRSKSGATLRFMPGVAVRAPTPDVMRGEEIQIFGSVGEQETATVVLPGTHSKWATVEDGRITGFRTFLTGEIFALLRDHSIVGRLIPPGERGFNEEAFLDGVASTRSSHAISLLNDVFTARSGALLGAFSADTIADRLSGILIGHEIAAGLTLAPAGRLVLVGEVGLSARYALALRSLGRAAELGSQHAAVAGFKRLAALDGA
ncbi:MAG: 2-dehydro-3-deoxygalactonokinase [Beijerinckiaceae bacterium]